MSTLASYLEKYKVLVPPEASVRKAVVSVVQRECSIVLEECDISLRNSGVMLSCHPAMRSEILRSAPRLISALKTIHNVHISFIR